MSASALPQVYEHPLAQRQPILDALRPHLPTSLAAYRRLQFQNYTPTSHLFSSLKPESLAEQDGAADAASAAAPWLAAFVDRSRRPETEVWMFASWETSATPGGDDWETHAARLVEALLRQIKRIGLGGGVEGPEALAGPDGSATAAAAAAAAGASENGAAGVGRGAYESHLANPNIVLFGALHERTTQVMKKMGVLPRELVGADIPYKKYIFRLSSKVVQDDTLTADLAWGKVEPEHFALVKSRTEIPRQDRTLRQLPSMAIFPKGSSAPIAWSFLGSDASLSTLHVEPEYRGRGLAKTLAAKLFAHEMHVYWQGPEGPDDYAHADVAVDNVASSGVCKSLNGSYTFHVFWVRLDLGRIS